MRAVRAEAREDARPTSFRSREELIAKAFDYFAEPFAEGTSPGRTIHNSG